jgi:3-hydroxyisobutyrate dehydrogenase-like beta-hydroxyacid dehydrogenase
LKENQPRNISNRLTNVSTLTAKHRRNKIFRGTEFEQAGGLPVDAPVTGSVDAAIGEAMVTAKKAGLEPEVWWAAMKGGAADSFVLQHDVPSIFAGHYDPSFRLALCLKDLSLIDELVQKMGTRSELTQATHARFREAAERYGGDAGEMTVCKLIEEDAGVELRVDGLDIEMGV